MPVGRKRARQKSLSVTFSTWKICSTLPNWMTSEKATMTDMFDDQKGRSPDDAENRVTTPNTHNAVSLHAGDKAAIGKAGEFEEIESNGERSASGKKFDARSAAWKEVIKIIRWLNGLTAALKPLHDDVEALADTIAVSWSDAQHLLPSLRRRCATDQRWVTSLTQRALDVAWDRWQQRNDVHNHTLHPWRAAEAIESRDNCNVRVRKAKLPFPHENACCPPRTSLPC
jgi:hypothetical protein